MPAVAKKSAKVAASKSDDAIKKPKKQSLKKTQKTADILAAKKLAKLKSTKAISDKLNRAPVVKKQKAKHQFDPTRLNRGVVLIQNLPRGFFEKQLKKYFTQYGRVTRLRLARSERTGGSKGYAFIEFKYPEVAKVAAESMNGYLMFRQKLKTVYIPPDEQDHDYFKQPVKFVKQKLGKVKLVTPKTVRAAKAVANYNKRVSDEVKENRVERSKYKLNFLQKKLAKAGIDIDLSSQLYTPVEKEVKDKKEVKIEKTEQKSKNVQKKDKKEKAQKVEKVEKKVRTNFVTPPTPEPTEKKKKKSKVTEVVTAEKPIKSKKKTVVSSEPETAKKKKVEKSTEKAQKLAKKEKPPKAKKVEKVEKKVRTNFVTPPTPEPIEKKKKKNSKVTEVVIAEKPIKTKKKTNVSIKSEAPKKRKQTHLLPAVNKMIKKKKM